MDKKVTLFERKYSTVKVIKLISLRHWSYNSFPWSDLQSLVYGNFEHVHTCDMWVAPGLPPYLAKLWEFRNFRGLMGAPQNPFPSSCHCGNGDTQSESIFRLYHMMPMTLACMMDIGYYLYMIPSVTTTYCLYGHLFADSIRRGELQSTFGPIILLLQSKVTFFEQQFPSNAMQCTSLLPWILDALHFTLPLLRLRNSGKRHFPRNFSWFLAAVPIIFFIIWQSSSLLMSILMDILSLEIINFRVTIERRRRSGKSTGSWTSRAGGCGVRWSTLVDRMDQVQNCNTEFLFFHDHVISGWKTWIWN